MDMTAWIQSRVSKYYRQDDINCATTTLKVLAEKLNVSLPQQVIDAALAMHGAGKYGAQCGLVEGTLMFMGIYGRANRIPDQTIVDTCREFAGKFESQFKSLQCRILRPQGFHPDNPPHLCEPLTCRAIQFSIDFISRSFLSTRQESPL